MGGYRRDRVGFSHPGAGDVPFRPEKAKGDNDGWEIKGKGQKQRENQWEEGRQSHSSFSKTIRIAPLGQTAAQMPHPLQ